MEKNYKLYMHTCPNGKLYFGITSQKVETRWNKGKGYIHNQYFTRAINKYEWNNIEHTVLAENLTEKEACHYEEFLITYFDTTNREKGYNIKSGGEFNKHSEESKRKISKASKGEKNGFFGKNHTEEAKRKIGATSKGRTPWNKGISCTEERKRKISEANKGNGTKKVKCIELDIIFPSVTEANMYFNKSKDNNSICLAIKRNGTCWTYHWEYIN